MIYNKYCLYIELITRSRLHYVWATNLIKYMFYSNKQYLSPREEQKNPLLCLLSLFSWDNGICKIVWAKNGIYNYGTYRRTRWPQPLDIKKHVEFFISLSAQITNIIKLVATKSSTQHRIQRNLNNSPKRIIY